jgi:hypothetical protein
MHIPKAIRWVLPVLLHCAGYSQTQPVEKGPATLTVEEARQAAKAVDTGENPNRLVNAALRAERLDLIAAYLEETITDGMIQNYVRTQMPTSRFKDQVVILILKSSPGWGWEPGRISYGRQPITPSINDEPFGSVFNKLLPGRWLTDDVFRSKASRAELASELERAIEQLSPEPKASPHQVNPSPAPSIPPETGPVLPRPELPIEGAAASSSERQTSTWPWVVGILILVVIVALALALKRRA